MVVWTTFFLLALLLKSLQVLSVSNAFQHVLYAGISCKRCSPHSSLPSISSISFSLPPPPYTPCSALHLASPQCSVFVGLRCSFAPFLLIVYSSDGQFRYNEVSIFQGQLSISTDKYHYLSLHENSEKISGNFEEILEENGKILK